MGLHPSLSYLFVLVSQVADLGYTPGLTLHALRVWQLFQLLQVIHAKFVMPGIVPGRVMASLRYLELLLVLLLLLQILLKS